MLDLTKLRLGKDPAIYDPRTLQMANYLHLAKAPAPIPAKKDWTKKQKDWGMMMNDSIGDCTCAGAGHLIQVWSLNESKEITIPDQAVLQAYEAVGGYKPKDPSTDRGCTELAVLKYWRRSGIGGHKIFAFVSTEPQNHDHVKIGVSTFGGVYIGLALPLSAQKQRVWSVPPSGETGDGQPGSWGGHCVVVVAYDGAGLTCITWGKLQRMTWSFWDTYCDESYVLLSKQDWVTKGTSPGGFDMTTLVADLNQL